MYAICEDRLQTENFDQSKANTHDCIASQALIYKSDARSTNAVFTLYVPVSVFSVMWRR